MSSTIETRQAILEATPEGTMVVRYRPGITLDKEGLAEVLAARERHCELAGCHKVLAVFPQEADFQIAVMTEDHYKGRPIIDCTRFLAIAANSVMHERMASLYFAYFPQSFETKVFVEEEEAMAWLTEKAANVALN
jgi:hypothetical protein